MTSEEVNKKLMTSIVELAKNMEGTVEFNFTFKSTDQQLMRIILVKGEERCTRVQQILSSHQ
jgi:hypothetical protein